MSRFDPGSDVVVRFHDLKRLNELERAVFSVVGQKVRPITAHLVTQRLGDAGVQAVTERLAPMFQALDGAFLQVHDWRADRPEDGRSCLLNEGVRHARRRYLSFLDYDDVLFPEAHEVLRGRLAITGAAIAFATVQIMNVAVYDHFLMPIGKRPTRVGGWTLPDLFAKNRAPIHSYVLDRERIPTGAIRFDESLTWEEDYEFLLRICAAYPCDLAAIDTVVGYYNFKTDGSNSVPTTMAAGIAPSDDYRQVQGEMARRKRQIQVAPEILEALGQALSPAAGGGRVSIADLLNELGR